MRSSARVFILAALGLAGCTSSDDPQLESLPPATPVATATAATREVPETGLCMSWSSSVIDVSAFRDAPYIYTSSSVVFHGFDGGVSLATTTMPQGGDITAMAIDGSGRILGGGAVTLPAEPMAEMTDVVATSDGGWLVAWLGNAHGSTLNGFAYTVRYDGSGAPVARSASVEAGWINLLAEASGGERALLGLTVNAAGELASTLEVATFPGGGAMPRVSPTFDEAADDGSTTDSFGGYRAGTLLTSLITTTSTGIAFRTWNDQGALLSATTMPIDGPFLSDEGYAGTDQGYGWYATAQYAPGAGGTAVVYAQPNAVAFITPARILLQPTDVVMNGAASWAEPSWEGNDRVVVGFGGHVLSASGGNDALQIVDVSTSGARGAVGSAALAATSVERDFSSGLQIAATTAEDAYAVFLLNQGSYADLAIFQCTSRAP